MVNIETFLTKIMNEQGTYKLRDIRHQQSTVLFLRNNLAPILLILFLACESNNSRLVWYTVVEIILLAVIYGCQAFLINKWFENRGLVLRQWA